MKALILLISCVISITASAQIFGGGGFPNVDPDHIPPNPYQRSYNRVSSCEFTHNGRTFRLHEPGGENIEKALEILDLTPTGRMLLQKFRHLNSQHPHEFVFLNEYSRRNYQVPPTAGAVYLYDITSRKIFFDPLEDLGLLPFMMAHEITHAIDTRVVPAYHEEVQAKKDFQNSKISEAQFWRIKHRNAWLIERHAFNWQDKVVAELIDLIPCYEDYLQEHREQNGLKVTVPTPDSFILNSYGLPADIVRERP